MTEQRIALHALRDLGPCPDHPRLSGSALPALAAGAPSIGRSSSGPSPAVTAAQPAALSNTAESACDHRAIHDRAAPTGTTSRTS